MVSWCSTQFYLSSFSWFSPFFSFHPLPFFSTSFFSVLFHQPSPPWCAIRDACLCSCFFLLHKNCIVKARNWFLSWDLEQSKRCFLTSFLVLPWSWRHNVISGTVGKHLNEFSSFLLEDLPDFFPVYILHLFKWFMIAENASIPQRHGKNVCALKRPEMEVEIKITNDCGAEDWEEEELVGIFLLYFD